MVSRTRFRFALLALAGLAGSPAARAAGPAADARALAGSIVDRYAPGVLETLPPGTLSPPGVLPQASVSGLASTSSAAQDASRQRAQAFLNTYAPGMVTLGERGVRVETPAAIVDTRPGATPVLPTDGRSMLHRLATAEATAALRADDPAKADRWIEAVAAERKGDPEVRQLQSMVLFRMNRFPEAADAAKAALRSGDPWDRVQLAALFPDSSRYDQSYLALREEAKKPSPDGKVLFLLAYHEQMLGRADEARSLLDGASAQLPEGWLPAVVRERFESE